MKIRTLAVPLLVLLAGSTLAACGDTEPAAEPTGDSMMEVSPTPDAMMSEDAMMEDEG